MTIESARRVAETADRIIAASPAEVQADIRRAHQGRRAEWMAEAAHGMTARFAGLRDLRAVPGPVDETVGPIPPEAGIDETIVFAIGTPVFLVKDNAIDIESARTEATAWRQIITANAAKLNRHMGAIGRINVTNLDTEFVGTAWVIDDGLVVTNRHVANRFAEASGAGFTFKLGFDARSPIAAAVDFLEEFGSASTDAVGVERVVWVASDSGPDVAFLKLAAQTGPAARVKLALASGRPPAKLPVAVIGYPANDFRFSDQQLASKIFGGIFDKKRLAVGSLLGVSDAVVTHSCSTLGGNSGSPVIDIGSGEVVGLHYHGVEFIENDAVPAAVLRRCLARAAGLLATTEETPVSQDEDAGTRAGQGRVIVNIPLRITIELGTAAVQAVATQGGRLAATPAVDAASGRADAVVNPGPEAVLAAVRTARRLLANRDDVVMVKPGYKFARGAVTDERAVVIAVRRKLEPGALASRGVVELPKVIDGVRTDVAVATTADLFGRDAVDEAVPKGWHTRYRMRPDLPLDRRTTKTRFVIHSGPDASWPQLSAFLAATTTSLVVAMYDFGAVNVVDGVLEAIKGTDETMALVLQMGGKVHTGDLTDYEAVEKIRAKKKAAFTFAPASIGKDGIFDSAYHIKVAVRDHASLWLSSGNWQNSNQPDIDPLTVAADAAQALRRYNREWHVILNDPALSELFEAHILRDLEEAKAVAEAPSVEEPMVFLPAGLQADGLEAVAEPRFFTPLIGEREIDVQPVLTPDNYIDVVVPFIESARRSVYFQNQSFNTKVIGGDYARLLDALLARQKAGLDVRIIFRSFGPDDRDVITAAKEYGFDTAKLKKQVNCHTKGIVVDGEAVLVGSHNWTTAGTGFNRDASLVFHDREIAGFYEKLFLYDWDRTPASVVDESTPPPILASAAGDTKPPAGYVAVPLSMMLGR